MDERMAFQETLAMLVEQAQISGNVLSYNDIADGFSELSFSDEQMRQVLLYLAAAGIRVTDLPETLAARAEEAESENVYMKAAAERLQAAEEEEVRKGRERRERKVKATRSRSANAAKTAPDGYDPSAGNQDVGSDSPFLAMYMRELQHIRRLERAEEKEILDRFMAGGFAEDESLFSHYVERKLHDVVNYAKGYGVSGAYFEELIEEGNLGLTEAVMELTPLRMDIAEDPVAFVNSRIEAAMERFIEETMTAEDQANAMVAKVGFLSEAAKQMKEDRGENPSLRELAAYTNLSEDELTRIMNLSSDNLKEK